MVYCVHSLLHVVDCKCSTVADAAKAPNSPSRWSEGLNRSKMKLYTRSIVGPSVYLLDQSSQQSTLNEQAYLERVRGRPV